MRLKRVEMIGFKSFMDRTVLDFRDGITTVLGPNGCGKSNVVDAVRWVLGEQSAKQLRGEKMEDVIFKGTRKRKPMSQAEVSLVFDNSAQRLPVPYDEVAITRRVSRAGSSDYFLNKTPCRLKDIKDLFYDTGVGNNAYSVIEQEVVGQVLDPSENKVRTILEEGSGIVRYKVKRKEALRKLDLTERDLLRVEDIIEEIGKQVRSLARQVGKARRHQRLYGEVRALEILRAHHKMQEVESLLAELRDREQLLRTEGSGDDAEAARLGAAIETMRPALDQLEHARRDRAHALSEVETRLNAAESELMVLREKIDSGTRRRGEIAEELERSGNRLEEIEGELDQAKAERADLGHVLREREAVVTQSEQRTRGLVDRFEATRHELARAQQLSLGFLREENEQKRDLTAAETRLESLQEEQSRVEAALQEAQDNHDRLRAELDDLQTRAEAAGSEQRDIERAVVAAQEDVAAAEQALQEAREKREAAADELARLESRHEIAARIASEFEGFRAGAAALLRDPERQARVRGAMAERLQVEAGYESAFELVFGEDADALLVDDVRDARELAQHLADEGLGTASFLAALGASEDDRTIPAHLPGRAALDLVRLDEAASPLLRRWLERVRVVETHDEAVAGVIEHAGHGYSFLSRQGLFLRHDGLVRGGAGSRRQLAFFGRQEQVDQLASEVERQEQILAERQHVQETARQQLESARQRVEQRRREVTQAQQSLAEIGRELAKRKSLLEREDQQAGRWTEQRQRVRGEIDSLLEKVGGIRVHLGRHGEDHAASKERADELAHLVSELEQQRDAAGRELSESRLQLTHDRGVDRELQSRIERLGNMADELRSRSTRLSGERETLGSDLDAWKHTVGQRTDEVSEGYRERETRREALRTAQEDIEVRRAEMEQLQEQLRAVDKRRRERGDSLHAVQSELTRLEFTGQNFIDRIREKFHVEIAEAFATLDPKDLPKQLVRDTGAVDVDEEGESIDDAYTDENGDPLDSEQMAAVELAVETGVELEGEVATDAMAGPELVAPGIGTFQVRQVELLLKERQEKLDKIGPVNFVALDEYDEKKERLEFLEKQRDDLLESKEDLLQAIDRINRTARQLFRDTYEQVRANFREIFTTLFEGGEADLVLHKSDDPLEGDIEVVARPSGKRVDNVSLLSGGERALTAIALLFAVYLIKPSPFCLLDEVDAPLDDMNVGRFVRLLERFAQKTQFIVITHNKLTMESADHLYGVTMEESGVSRLVSVSFEELDREDPIAALESIAHERADVRAHPEQRLLGKAVAAEAGNGNGDHEAPQASVAEAGGSSRMDLAPSDENSEEV